MGCGFMFLHTSKIVYSMVFLVILFLKSVIDAIIGCFYFILCSLDGFSDLGMLECINENVIDDIEIFIKTKGLAMIAGKVDLVYFLGEYFVGNEANFEFNLGERTQLLKVAEYTKSTQKEKHEKPSGVKRKRGEETKIVLLSSEIAYFQCLNGWLFKKQMNTSISSSDKNSSENPVHTSQHKNDLFNTMVNTIKKQVKKDYWKLLEGHLKDDLVFVIEHKNGNIGGSIQCIFCDMEEKKKTISISTKTVNGPKGKKSYWVNSNFAEHIKSHLSKGMPEISEIANKKPECRSTKDAPYHENDYGDKPTNQNHISYEDGIMDKAIPADDIVTHSISLLDDKTLFTQISEQIQKVSIHSMQMNNYQTTIAFKIDGHQRNLKIIPMKPNGSCFYNAIVHQLNPSIELNSDEFETNVMKLRRECVAYIEENFDYFRRQLENRVLDETIHEMSKSELELKCNFFLSNELPESTCWGGCESIIAVSDLKSVNILIFNEDGEIQCGNKLNASYNRTICIAYRLENNADCDDNYETIEDITLCDVESENETETTQKRNHYDSVSSIVDQDIYDLSQYIVDRNIVGQNRTICLEIEESIHET